MRVWRNFCTSKFRKWTIKAFFFCWVKYFMPHISFECKKFVILWTNFYHFFVIPIVLTNFSNVPPFFLVSDFQWLSFSSIFCILDFFLHRLNEKVAKLKFRGQKNGGKWKKLKNPSLFIWRTIVSCPKRNSLFNKCLKHDAEWSRWNSCKFHAYQPMIERWNRQIMQIFVKTMVFPLFVVFFKKKMIKFCFFHALNIQSGVFNCEEWWEKHVLIAR